MEEAHERSGRYSTATNPLTLHFGRRKLELQYQSYLYNLTWKLCLWTMTLIGVFITLEAMYAIYVRQSGADTRTKVVFLATAGAALLGLMWMVLVNLCPFPLRKGVHKAARTTHTTIGDVLADTETFRLAGTYLFSPIRPLVFKVSMLVYILVVTIVPQYSNSTDNLEIGIMIYFIAFLAAPICGYVALSVCYVVTCLVAVSRIMYEGVDLEPFLLDTIAFAVYGIAVIVVGRTAELTYRHSFASAYRARRERLRGKQVLAHMLPEPVTDDLMQQLDRMKKIGDSAPLIAQRYNEVTVVFIELMEYEHYVSCLPPEPLMDLLSSLFTHWDVLVERHGLYTVQNIGGSYMFAAGCPSDADITKHPELRNFSKTERNAASAALLALDIMKHLEDALPLWARNDTHIHQDEGEEQHREEEREGREERDRSMSSTGETEHFLEEEEETEQRKRRKRKGKQKEKRKFPSVYVDEDLLTTSPLQRKQGQKRHVKTQKEEEKAEEESQEETEARKTTVTSEKSAAKSDGTFHRVQIRMGINTGPLQAGVTGATKFAFHLFGDTVNTSARMETNSFPMRIQMTPATARILRSTGLFIIEKRGKIPIKGKGLMNVYFLNGVNRHSRATLLLKERHQREREDEEQKCNKSTRGATSTLPTEEAALTLESSEATTLHASTDTQGSSPSPPPSPFTSSSSFTSAELASSLPLSLQAEEGTRKHTPVNKNRKQEKQKDQLGEKGSTTITTSSTTTLWGVVHSASSAAVRCVFARVPIPPSPLLRFQKENPFDTYDITRSILSCEMRTDFLDWHYGRLWASVVLIIAVIGLLDFWVAFGYQALVEVNSVSLKCTRNITEHPHNPNQSFQDTQMLLYSTLWSCVSLPPLCLLAALAGCAPRRLKLWRLFSYVEPFAVFLLSIRTTVRVFAVETYGGGLMAKIVYIFVYQFCLSTHYTLSVVLSAIDVFIFAVWAMSTTSEADLSADEEDLTVDDSGETSMFLALVLVAAWAGSIPAGFFLHKNLRLSFVMHKALLKEYNRTEKLLQVVLPENIRDHVLKDFDREYGKSSSALARSFRTLWAALSCLSAPLVRVWNRFGLGRVFGSATTTEEIQQRQQRLLISGTSFAKNTAAATTNLGYRVASDASRAGSLLTSQDGPTRRFISSTRASVGHKHFYANNKSYTGRGKRKRRRRKRKKKEYLGAKYIVEHHPRVSVLFSDIVGFTALSSTLEPHELFNTLNLLYTSFDRLAKKLGVFKIEVIGDAYVCAAGLVHQLPDHADVLCEMAFGMQKIVREVRDTCELDIAMRVGIHTGPVLSGIIGRKSFRYAVWGTTLLIAEQMESNGVPWRVHVSEETRAEMKKHEKKRRKRSEEAHASRTVSPRNRTKEAISGTVRKVSVPTMKSAAAGLNMVGMSPKHQQKGDDEAHTHDDHDDHDDDDDDGEKRERKKDKAQVVLWTFEHERTIDMGEELGHTQSWLVNVEETPEQVDNTQKGCLLARSDTESSLSSAMILQM